MIGLTKSTIHTDTAHAGTKEWLQASRNMVIVAYVGDRATLPSVSTAENEESLFGTHIKETATAFRRLLGRKTE